MKIYSVYTDEFKPYGKILQNYDTQPLISAMRTIPMPESGTAYEPSIDALEACGIFDEMRDRAYGGMPIQIGMCWGYNTKLNCLEYHRDSELNLGSRDFILLVAKREDMEDGRLDTAKVQAFHCPAGVLVEVYATTLHYAPCSAKKGAGFRVLIVLPLGTNGPRPEISPKNEEDRRLWACNKWLLAHRESSEAAQGAPVLLEGVNLDIGELLP